MFTVSYATEHFHIVLWYWQNCRIILRPGIQSVKKKGMECFKRVIRALKAKIVHYNFSK